MVSKRRQWVGAVLLVSATLCACGDRVSGAPVGHTPAPVDTPAGVATQSTLSAGAKPLQRACTALTASGAATLLGIPSAELDDDEGDMCIYAHGGANGPSVVFELMWPFGADLFAIEQSKSRDRTPVNGVGAEAFMIRDGKAVVIDAFQGGVFLRLSVTGASDAGLSGRMQSFAKEALAGY